MSLPALRTVHAVLPHTALQSLVSSSGVSRLHIGRIKGEQPMSREESVLASFDAVDQRRHHALRPDRGFRPSPGWVESVCPLLSRSRHCRDFLCRHPDLAPPTPCLPSLGMVLLPTPLAAVCGIGTMKGSDFCRGHPPRQISSLTSPCRPDIQTPTTRAAQWSLCQSPQRHRLFPGFATNEQARHSATPNRVCQPTDCRFTSGCFPPRLTATQLPAITEPATGSGADLHRASKAPSRGALIRAQARIHCPVARILLGFSVSDSSV